MPHSYLSIPQLKTVQGIASTDTADDTRLRAVLEAIARTIDDECARTFRVYLATNYYTARRSNRLYLDQDLLSLTTLKTDSDGDRTYEDTWDIAGANADVDLKPDNAASLRLPYWELEVTPDGLFSFPTTRRGVEIVGKWGYWEELETVASTAAEAIDTTEIAIDVTAGTDFEALQTILIDSEQMYVLSISSNTITVERAVNGTTAASHITASVIQRYRYPSPIVEAARILAARIFRRPEAAFGVIGSADMGTAAVISRIDPDVKMLLAHYRSGLGMVA